jgi:hypothetical protein
MYTSSLKCSWSLTMKLLITTLCDMYTSHWRSFWTISKQYYHLDVLLEDWMKSRQNYYSSAWLELEMCHGNCSTVTVSYLPLSAWDNLLNPFTKVLSLFYLTKKTKHHSPVHKNLLLVIIPSQTNPLHNTTPSVLKVRFNIILPSTSRSFNSHSSHLFYTPW